MTDSQYRYLFEKSPVSAQKALFDEYLNYVYSIVYNKLRSCGSKEDIEECVGDVFAAVFMSYDSNGSFDGDLKGIIGTIAFRKAVQCFRKLSNTHGLTVSAEGEYFELPDNQNIVENTEKNELRNVLINTINSLGEPDSTIILQKYYYNMNSREIAEKLSMTSDSVRVRCGRAIKKIKSLLLEKGYDIKEGNI